MKVTLMGRVAVITGASRGIGAATALVLAQQGFRVVVNYRSSAEQADDVVQAATAAGGEAVAIQADVTEADQVDAMVRDTEQRWGGVDVLVHNALIPFDVTSFADLSWEQLGGKLDRELSTSTPKPPASRPCCAASSSSMSAATRCHHRRVRGHHPLDRGRTGHPQRTDHGARRAGGAAFWPAPGR
jgi:hypothetical protein